VTGAPTKSLRPLYQVYGLSFVAAVLHFLGWAGFGVWPFAIVCMVPFFTALELGLDRGWHHSLAVGWFYGAVSYAGGYHWLVEFLEVFSGYGLALSAFFFVAFCIYLGFDYALYAALYRTLRKGGWSTAAIAIPILLLMEWGYPALFPTYLANSFHMLTWPTQMADLGGPLLVTALIGAVNLAIYETWRWRAKRREAPKLLWGIAAAGVLFSLGYGAIRVHQIEARMADAPVLRVGIVQVNMGIFAKWEEAIEGHRRHLEQSHELGAEDELDLLIWPESAIVRSLPRKLPWNGDRIRRDLKTPILFGGVSTEEVDGERKIYNTVFSMDADGMVRSTYDKTYLLMFGEYLPFGETFPILYDLSPNSGRFTAGSHVRPVTLGKWRISTPVCYEDILAGFTRKMVREAKPHVMINLTNDAWFGDTQEPWIHLLLSKYRAIEHRRYLVRSTNSGISAVIDPLGRVVAKSGLLTRENLRADIRMLDEDTVYTLLGDWPGWLSLIAIGWMIIRRRDAAR
jgi:apolipoprotein N-acyltransferase